MINKIKDFFDLAQENMGALTLGDKILVLFHYAQGRLLYNASKKEFFQFKLHEKNLWGKNQIVGEKRIMAFARNVNDQEDSIFFKDKAQFFKKFTKYVQREALDMSTATKAEFTQFASKHKRFFVKPTRGFFGYGAYIEECDDFDSIDRAYDKVKGTPVILEELIKQSEVMSRFNASTVNTIRIVTFVGADGKPFIFEGAALRTGRAGRDADNFHHGGVGAKIDIETGIVCTKGVDKSGARYVKHPDSGTVFVGFQVPLWEDICKTVKEAALVVPSVRYVGWDVAITENNKIILIEGNDAADPDLAQMSDGVGLWHTFKMHMDEIKALKEGS